MDALEFAESIYLCLPYEPNEQQIKLIASLARFVTQDNTGSPRVFLLNGYAGTGKTSLTGALVQALRPTGIPVVLMAPTGRAAKVFGAYASYPASTIHRRIYRTDTSAGPSDYSRSLAENKLHNAIFIVDEASMIGNDTDGEGKSLLSDLIEYVYSAEGCRMILLGDTAQLPPVGLDKSPAMEPDTLRAHGLKVSHAVLTKVVRQGAHSGILLNATRLRRQMTVTPCPLPSLILNRFPDCSSIPSEELEDAISQSYYSEGEGNTLVITRSNKRAVLFNLAIRSRILGREEELCVGERIMVAKNNYLWSAKIPALDFVANGDMAIVERVYGTEEKYGFRFADVSLQLYDRDITFDCKIMLDTLISESPALEPARTNALYMAALNDADLFAPTHSIKSRMRALRSDPYVNALQIKYAYAVTCHKAQGGQWPSVFIDPGFIPPDSSSIDILRWFYTALTRSTGSVRIINAPAEITGGTSEQS